MTRKLKVFSALLAAFALASCSSEDLFNSQNEEVNVKDGMKVTVEGYTSDVTRAAIAVIDNKRTTLFQTDDKVRVYNTDYSNYEVWKSATNLEKEAVFTCDSKTIEAGQRSVAAFPAENVKLLGRNADDPNAVDLQMRIPAKLTFTSGTATVEGETYNAYFNGFPLWGTIEEENEEISTDLVYLTAYIAVNVNMIPQGTKYVTLVAVDGKPLSGVFNAALDLNEPKNSQLAIDEELSYKNYIQYDVTALSRNLGQSGIIYFPIIADEEYTDLRLYIGNTDITATGFDLSSYITTQGVDPTATGTEVVKVWNDAADPIVYPRGGGFRTTTSYSIAESSITPKGLGEVLTAYAGSGGQVTIDVTTLDLTQTAENTLTIPSITKDGTTFVVNVAATNGSSADINILGNTGANLTLNVGTALGTNVTAIDIDAENDAITLTGQYQASITANVASLTFGTKAAKAQQWNGSTTVNAGKVNVLFESMISGLQNVGTGDVVVDGARVGALVNNASNVTITNPSSDITSVINYAADKKTTIEDENGKTIATLTTKNGGEIEINGNLKVTNLNMEKGGTLAVTGTDNTSAGFAQIGTLAIAGADATVSLENVHVPDITHDTEYKVDLSANGYACIYRIKDTQATPAYSTANMTIKSKWDGESKANYQNGYVYTAAQFANLNNTAANSLMANEIDLDSKNWFGFMPEISQVFDGQNCEIKNLNIVDNASSSTDPATTTGMGLFKTASANISNVKLNGVTITSDKADANIGALVGIENGAVTYSNIEILGDNNTIETANGYNIGGLIGQINHSTVGTTTIGTQSSNAKYPVQVKMKSLKGHYSIGGMIGEVAKADYVYFSDLGGTTPNKLDLTEIVVTKTVEEDTDPKAGMVGNYIGSIGADVTPANQWKGIKILSNNITNDVIADNETTLNFNKVPLKINSAENYIYYNGCKKSHNISQWIGLSPSAAAATCVELPGDTGCVGAWNSQTVTGNPAGYKNAIVNVYTTTKKW